MSRILLMGYFGAGNFGDDALLVDWLLRRRDWLTSHGLQVDVISSGADPVGGFVEGDSLRQLIATEIPKQAALKLNPKDYAALIAPGGSLLQDSTSVRSLMYYLLLLRRFHAANIPTFLLNQGIGPLNSWAAGFFTPRHLAGCTMLSLRDLNSHDYCLRNSYLSATSGLVHSADPIVCAAFAPSLDSAPGLDCSEPFVLAIPRPTGDLPTPIEPVEETTALARLLDHSAEVTGLKTVLLGIHPSQDQAFCQSVAAEMETGAQVVELGEETTHPLSTIWQVIGSASLVISYRLHGLVSAVYGNVPSFGVAYDPKINTFCNEAGLPHCYPATVHENDSLDDLRRLWNDRESVKEYMNSQRQNMIRRLDEAEVTFDELWQ